MTDINEIMGLFNANGGVGVRLDGKPYPIRAGEEPLRYFKRVMEEHNAWKAGKEATAPRPKASADGGGEESRRGGEAVEPGADRSDGEGAIQEREASLEATIKSQVATLRRSRQAWQGKVESASNSLRESKARLKEIERELEYAERFLRELSPEVHRETSEAVPPEATKESRGSSPVGTPGDPVAPKRTSKRRNKKARKDGADAS